MLRCNIVEGLDCSTPSYILIEETILGPSCRIIAKDGCNFHTIRFNESPVEGVPATVPKNVIQPVVVANFSYENTYIYIYINIIFGVSSFGSDLLFVFC